ncbi:hypothetical protein Z945_1564 [Sulfitobacter noctilucae]|nr:hypothetical protein Z945_1564 [Sulfitobacter noctilucae]
MSKVSDRLLMIPSVPEACGKSVVVRTCIKRLVPVDPVVMFPKAQP